MFLRSIRLLAYKNYASASTEFHHTFNLINGRNGSGKTNLIDAIHYLCLCKSYFTRADAQVMRHGDNFFRIDGVFDDAGRGVTITCTYQGGKKEVAKNGVPYERLADHIGLIPVAMIAPDDIAIINDGSEERRRFLDSAIAQVNSGYLQRLIRYNRVLSQRNAMLKQALSGGRADDTLLGILNHQLAEDGNALYRERAEYLSRFRPLLKTIYTRLSGGDEEAEIEYQSQLEGHDHLQLLLRSERDDRGAGRTTVGIHKDDLLLSVKGYPVRDTGSQGQIKSFLIALKLAQCKLMEQTEGKNSILLLDDIFEKLDKQRLEVLFTMLQEETFGQIFITDADTERSKKFCDSHLADYGHYSVEDAAIQYI